MQVVFRFGLTWHKSPPSCGLLDDAAAGEEDSLQVHLELLRRVGELEGGFLRDVAVLRQLEEALVEGHHAFLFAAGDGLRDFFKLVVENQFLDDGRVDENFIDDNLRKVAMNLSRQTRYQYAKYFYNWCNDSIRHYNKIAKFW